MLTLLVVPKKRVGYLLAMVTTTTAAIMVDF